MTTTSEDAMRAWIEPIAIVGTCIAVIVGVGIVTESAVWAVLFAIICALAIVS